MQTRFSAVQLEDPQTAVSETAIRTCVHCGNCNATCPTYVLLGDERDGPRGRIYMMKNMLEHQRAPSAEVVKHIDRCLSCLSCMTTCPSGVNYMHLVDHARAYIQKGYSRPLADKVIRRVLALVLPFPLRFRMALYFGRVVKPLGPLFDRCKPLRPLAAMLALTPDRIPRRNPLRDSPQPCASGRVALLQGCAEPVLRPQFRAAAVRLINRVGFDVVFAPGEQCCGALVHHMGREAEAVQAAKNNVDAWTALIEHGGLDGIIVTASGCGTVIKDYGFILRNDPIYAAKAARVSQLSVDISQFLARCDMPQRARDVSWMSVAYHGACSLHHGQRISDTPESLLRKVGFQVASPQEAHLCCGSAGVYNVLQPDIAGQLGDRKAEQLEKLGADVIATGNIGCAVHIGARSGTPVVHTIELLDWATGGPRPVALRKLT